MSGRAWVQCRPFETEERVLVLAAHAVNLRGCGVCPVGGVRGRL